MANTQKSSIESLRIGLATVKNAPFVDDRLATLDQVLTDAAAQEVAIVCFPEAYIPGLRGFDFAVPPVDQLRQEAALRAIRDSAKQHAVAVVVGMEWETDIGQHNAAFVIGRDGVVQGYQVKNQLPPEEVPFYKPDGQRRLFDIDGVTFGIAICHEGWRYPESVRWAATRSAKIVFHPQLTGSDTGGTIPRFWGDPAAPYYEKAMIARAVENNVYFASVNYLFRYQESATSLIDPDGHCQAFMPYGESGLLVQDIDPGRATGFYADRYDPSLYGSE